MSRYDYPRADFVRPQMGDETAEHPAMNYRDDVLGDARMPGGPAAARTQYPTKGHRAPPTHVTQAHRRQVLIDASAGRRMYEDAEDRLRNDAADAAALKVQSHASAVNQAIMRDSTHAGYLG